MKIFNSCKIFLTVLLPVMMSAQDIPAGTADGYLIVAGDSVALQQASALAQPGFFDKSKEDIVVIVTNIPLPSIALDDHWERSALAREGTLKSVEITINDAQQPISVSLRHPAFQAAPSGFSSHYILQIETVDFSRIRGRMYCREALEFFDTRYRFDFTFDAPVQRKPAVSPATSAEKQAAASSPQAALYREYLAALQAADVNALKKILAPDMAAELDGPEQQEMLEFIQMITPADAEYMRITVLGDSAVLELSAQEEQQQLQGTVTFIRHDGRWKLTGSEWQDK